MGEIRFDYDLYHRKTEEVVAKTEAFALGKTREFFPVLSWSHGDGAFGLNSRYRDVMLKAQLDGISRTFEADTDWVPFIEPWHGVGVYAQAFGCPFEWNDDTSPWTHPIISNIDQLRAVEKPEIEKSEMLQYILETIRYFDKETGGQLYMSSTDTQSPLDTATLIMDTDFFFYAAMDYPEELRRLLGYITDIEIEFTRMQRELMSRPLTPGHNSWCHPGLPGLGLSEDCMCMVGPDFFDEFARPYNERIAEAFGGVAIHSCGVWSQNYEIVHRLKGLVEVDLAVHKDWDPTPNVPEVVRDGLKGASFITKVRWPGYAMELLDRVYSPDLRLIWEMLWDDDPRVRQSNYDTAKRRYEELATGSAQRVPGSRCMGSSDRWSGGFDLAELPPDEVVRLEKLSREARGDILSMTTRAGSGHPGGSLSSIDIFLVLWSYAAVSPKSIDDPSRDRIVISHGHTAPAVYAALGRTGYFDPEEAIRLFRRAGSPFEGHADPQVPGVEWECGNLGQGLSAASGMALASRLTGHRYSVYCVMGDGEQQKGQVAEARRFAARYDLGNLVAIVDCNGLQAMGSVDQTMPQDLAREWEAAGWIVNEADGHDHAEIYRAMASACGRVKPTVILARTVMGRGVSFMENRYEYHGKVLSEEECDLARAELRLPAYHPPAGDAPSPSPRGQRQLQAWAVRPGTPRDYRSPASCRGAFGNALADLALRNPDVPMAVFDCDLSASVKTDGFKAVRPDSFVQCGIQEHSTATIAGAAAKSGVLSFFADFGVFGICETYNQHRMNDINEADLKLVCTHCGLDAGEDGKTHQCLDYIGLLSNLHATKLIVTADANQTDRAIRYAACTPGRFAVAVGRSDVPIIASESGDLLYGGDYRFDYGRADWVRQGCSAVIIASGATVSMAVEVSRMLSTRGVGIGVLNLSCPFAIDEDKVREAAETGLLITYEDHNVRTGIGSLVAGFTVENGLRGRLLRFGVSRYGVSGSPIDNYRLQGLDPESVAGVIERNLG